MADATDNSLVSLAGGDTAQRLIHDFANFLNYSSQDSQSREGASNTADAISGAEAVAETFAVGIAALDAFLQANVTGPVLPEDLVRAVERRFLVAWQEKKQRESIEDLRRTCLRHLDVDGVSPYAHIPHLELFAFARYIITHALRESDDIIQISSSPDAVTKHSLTWTRLRVNTWHYKLLTQPSLGHGSNFTKSAQWSDVPTLVAHIIDGLEAVGKRVLGDDGEVWASESADTWSQTDQVTFLLEASNTYILLGRNDLSQDTLKKATKKSGLSYALSGALGKRTRFQEKNISQLVVLALSGGEQSESSAGGDDESARPDALKLNNDTLLEEIQFTPEAGETKSEELPSTLASLTPDNQPQLSPLDQIILLTEATLKDSFSPIDTLTSQEILPYAVRVLADKSTNWQIYTQALLVRSRIEVHRSRTVERGVLQLQAVADQVLTDTTAAATTTTVTSSQVPEEPSADSSTVPSIQLTTPGQDSSTSTPKPTSFLPAPKPSESAPANARLQYIHALSTPPRWHLESELAYAWAGVGSLTSALEIFKRLRLWAEVALCLASTAAIDDEDGRGSGGEDKAKGIIRWRLFHRTGADAASSPPEADDDLGASDVTELRRADFSGPERDPPPPNAARLWCILGDLESDPSHYERAWEISNYRYSRAQKSLGEYYLGQKDWAQARTAYKKATSANRLSSDMWSRLGDINLRLANFEEAAEAYSRAIGSATAEAGGEGARTWSNLGSALWSLYCEVTGESKEGGEAKDDATKDEAANKAEIDDDADNDIEMNDISSGAKTATSDPSKLLAQSLAAYKKGASVAHDNWRIWDNVLTLSSRMRPPSVADMVLSLNQIIRIRKSEDAVDADVLSALLSDVVLTSDRAHASSTGVYEPPRGSIERLVCRLLEEQVVPLITKRSELWTLVSRLRTWKRDYPGAIDAAERAWRAAVGSSSSGLLPGTAAGSSSSPLSPSSTATGDYASDKAAWDIVVTRTDELASLLENYGPDVETIGPKWKGKARNAVRSVMGRGRENWEGSEGWKALEGIMEGLKVGS